VLERDYLTYVTATSETCGFCLIGDVSPTPDICRVESLIQCAEIGSDALKMNVLPPSSARTSLLRKMETWVLKPVVAPQFLEKTTALNAPDGEAMVCKGTFSHALPQPARSDAKKSAVKGRNLAAIAL